MCGIFGLALKDQKNISIDTVRLMVNDLFRLSETRGREAAGLAVVTPSGIHIFKEAMAASDMIKNTRYHIFWQKIASDYSSGNLQCSQIAIIGHSRLVTNGLQGVDKNNQPVEKNGIIAVHNGIIVNDKALWTLLPENIRESDVDTEVFVSLLSHSLAADANIHCALKHAFEKLVGSASVGLLFSHADVMALATNTGSLYYMCDNEMRGFCFMSESISLNAFKAKTKIDFGQVRQLKPHQAILFNLESFQETVLSLKNHPKNPLSYHSKYRIIHSFEQGEKRRETLKRCSQCILPETFPGISFDARGICSVCKSYIPIKPKGKNKLIEILPVKMQNNDKADCLIAFSGGRDSSYMLHYAVHELGLHPITYSYDWGMVTDIARRNQARMSGALGIEHIYISADIRQKRRHIQMNIKAWMKRPSLGMIPLFMAGDKEYFYHGLRLQKAYDLSVTFLGGNPLERTGFKTGFTGVNEEGRRTYDISALKKLQLLSFYGGQFLRNPAYLNPSLIDTAFAYYASYMMKHNFVWLYHYILWEEQHIDTVLHDVYDWETASDSFSTWRIGDGTAAFYNYIYYTVAGFSEHDTLRSNQIREGMLTREAALNSVIKENQPRYESMRIYAQQIGFDLDEALQVIHNMKKLY